MQFLNKHMKFCHSDDDRSNFLLILLMVYGNHEPLHVWFLFLNFLLWMKIQIIGAIKLAFKYYGDGYVFISDKFYYYIPVL